MATTYNTLSLEKSQREKKRSIASYVAVGLLVVAFAGAGSVLVKGRAESALDAQYDDYKADVPDCMSRAANGEAKRAVELKMPLYDARFSAAASKDRAFYNACYYGYMCCTEVEEACLASNGYGEKCEGCLYRNGPRMVIPVCAAIMKAAPKNNVKFGMAEIRKDQGIPDVSKWTGLSGQVKQAIKEKKGVMDSCWRHAGRTDARMNAFVANCWDAISWCNSICPRDMGHTKGMEYCKECVNLGFNEQAKGSNFKTRTVMRKINGKMRPVRVSYGLHQGAKKMTKAELKKEREARRSIVKTGHKGEETKLY